MHYRVILGVLITIWLVTISTVNKVTITSDKKLIFLLKSVKQLDGKVQTEQELCESECMVSVTVKRKGEVGLLWVRIKRLIR